MLPGPAKKLDDFHKVLSLQPLMSQEEIDRWYEPSLNDVRSEHPLVIKLAQKLRDRLDEPNHFHAFVYGHLGCGKSTELTRLALRLAPREDGKGYLPVRISATSELAPAGFKPLDILLLILARFSEEVRKREYEPGEAVVKRVWEWFLAERRTLSLTTSKEVGGGAGMGVDAKSIWANLLGVFAEIRGYLKLSSLETSEKEEYSIKFLKSLTSALNDFLADCDKALPEGQKWLLMFEDFDKVPNRKTVEELFVGHGPTIDQLQVHAVFTIPAALAYAKQNAGLPFVAYPLYDTPVFDRNHRPHAEGRAAMRSLLARRVDLSLFESEHQVDRIIVASGGHPRDLFQMADEAAESARLKDREIVAAKDVTWAIAQRRRQTYLRLGEDPFEVPVVKSDEKLARLKQLYDDPSPQGLPDHVLYSLLSGRLIGEFNGDGWFGVPPLVVDILIEFKIFERGSPGGLLEP